MQDSDIPAVLSVAGSDPCAGAGIQADLKTFAAQGVYGLTAVTAVTVQNTQQVYQVQEIPSDVVYEQILRLFQDIRIRAVKIGMVYSAEVVKSIQMVLNEFSVSNLVVDPVMVSTSGQELLKREARESLLNLLFPMATLVTPNIHEAEVISGKGLEKWEDVEQAAVDVLDLGPGAVVIKGGGFRDRPGCDFYCDRYGSRILESEYVAASTPHGTGCTFSSAIASGLAKGYSPEQAVQLAKEYTTGTIKRCLRIGKGREVPAH
ncbi:MAG: bifunctional hydroxymethylpyrimidine kinase/phosphomethylpyrimidine kinase [Thermodesulfobacteriota bacterium]